MKKIILTALVMGLLSSTANAQYKRHYDYKTGNSYTTNSLFQTYQRKIENIKPATGNEAFGFTIDNIKQSSIT